MLIAVTGATGFIGRYLVEHLISEGNRLRCSFRPTSDRTGLASLADRIEWMEADLSRPQSMQPLIAGADAVVHAAVHRFGQDSFRESGQSDPVAFAKANLIGSLELMHRSREAGIERFVYVSTCAVHEIILDDRPLDENHPLWPTTHYGAHKAAVEAFVASYGRGASWPICALRPCGVYGLARPTAASKFYELVGRVLRGEHVASTRGGKEVHAADVARAVGLLLHAEPQAVAGQAFNCCDRYIADQEVARIAKDLSGSASKIELVNRGPKHRIETGKLEALGFNFGGEPLLKKTIGQLIKAQRNS